MFFRLLCMLPFSPKTPCTEIPSLLVVCALSIVLHAMLLQIVLCMILDVYFNLAGNIL